MTDGTYRVLLRARQDGVWQVFFFNGKQQLFCIPYRKQGAAEFMASKMVDELLRNQQEFSCDVQDASGQTIPINLLGIGKRRKVRGS